MKIDMQGAEPGMYHWNGLKLTRVFSCHECDNSARSKLMQIAREISDLKTRDHLLEEIEREDWSGAGYD